jgi:predicted N-formylglutamate amidohydrolase
MARRERALLISCEHGGNRVPRQHAPLFRGKERLLGSHRGWDPGALAFARSLARATGAPLIAATTTRLLIDLNRSPHNPRVFSSITRGLPLEERRELLARHHAPHWQRVRESILRLRGTGRPVIHLGVHGFTPLLAGARRDFEIGLLYDPRRTGERVLARSWQKRLREFAPELRVRRNAPYRGDADGLTTALRHDFGPREYLGFELELNQRVLARVERRRRLLSALSKLLAAQEDALALDPNPPDRLVEAERALDNAILKKVSSGDF